MNTSKLMKVLAMIALTLVLTSCHGPRRSGGESEQSKEIYYLYNIDTRSVGGHDYVVVSMIDYRGGVSIIHAAHCSCNQTTPRSKE